MGKEYFKCDLHIHSDKSNETKNKTDYVGEFSVEKLVEKLTFNNIEMFSITDHNCINTEAYDSFYVDYKDCGLELLIGVEFDIHKEEKLFESLDNLITNDKVINKKYHSLIIFKSKNVKKINGLLEQMYKEIESDFEKEHYAINFSSKNKRHRLTSLDRIIRTFTGEEILVISHGNKSSSIIETYKEDISVAQAMILLGVINSVEMGPTKLEAITHFNAGFDNILQDNYKGRADVPYVIFSDNHELDYYPHYKKEQVRKNRPFTWLRGTPNFETLRLSFVDPSSRIVLSHIQPSKPSRYLERVAFKTIDVEDNDIDIELNLSSGINTIIGGRSSGKSMLLNAILYNIIETRDNSEIKNYAMDSNKVIDISSIKGSMSSEKIMSNSNNCESIAYTQDKIVSMFEEDGSGLDTELPFSKYDESSKILEMNENLKILDELNLKYEEAFEARFDKNVIVSSKDFTLSQQKKTVEYSYSDAETAINSSIVEPPESVKNTKKEIDDLIEKLSNALDLKIGEKDIFDDQEKIEIEKTLKILTVKSKQVKDYYSVISFKSLFLKHLELCFQKEAQLLNSQKDTLISEAQKRLDYAVHKSKNYFTSRLLYEKAIDALEKIEMEFKPLDKKISADHILRTEIKYKLNKDKVYSSLNDKILNFNILQPKVSLLSMVYDNDDIRVKRKTNKPSDFKDMISKLKSEIQDLLTPKYSIIEVGTFKELSSDHMSPGKKASVYLEIVLRRLKEASQPTILIIDQPEDNLDNQFITDTLVSHIRDLRGLHQVIIVTHNASIAINSDSDNIIIAENDGSIISYENAGLEDISYREKVCNLLDGGHYTFDQRYHKYDIPNRKIYEPIEEGDIHEI